MLNNAKTDNLSHIMWYTNPAKDFNDALPVGNGRIGGMVYGNPLQEKIHLNEDSVWSGGYRERNNASAFPNLSKVRQLIDDEKIEEAEAIVNEAFCGTPPNERHYMPLGDLSILHINSKKAEFIKRWLDLTQGVVFTKYKIGKDVIRREVICSQPDQVMAINVKSETNCLSLKISIDGRDDYFDSNKPVNDSDICYFGGCGCEDSQFCAYIRVIGTDGKVYGYGNNIQTENCSQVTIIIGVQTSYRCKDYAGQAKFDVESACKYTFLQLKQRHFEDYKSLFYTAEVHLEDENLHEIEKLPTNERLARFKKGKNDNKLIEMYFNFGRYLMISASRENTLPMNLQGIWNKDMWPAWGCRFTVNINTQMNYWPAEVWGLSQLHYPLFDHIEKIRKNGRVTAKEMYGCRGFVCHHNTDLWGDTAPQDVWTPATQWPMGGAWLCLHIWEHYLFTQDVDFLDKKFDALVEASLFFVDFLTEDKNGRLTTCPSVSPENTYITKSGSKGSICRGPSMDSQIIYQLFTATIESGKILGREKKFCMLLEEMREKLPKPDIGKYGQIMEWAEDYDEVEPGHRHISQLFALYPADIISKRKTPKLAQAAKNTIERRLTHGGGHTGWSRAWIINYWARLFEGEKVEENIRALLNNSTYENLFDMHPPFQIDGNFGASAGIAEALLQSENDEIIFLPAIPPSWKNGCFIGLCARGGFSVDCTWENLKITNASITSKSGKKCRVVCKENVGIFCEGNPIDFEYIGDLAQFDTEKGKKYQIFFKDGEVL